MKQVCIALVVIISLLITSCGVVLAAQDVPGPNVNQGWPFGDGPQESRAPVRDEFLISMGANAFVPGSLVTTALGVSFRVAPFFTESQTEVVAWPSFAVAQSLETGVGFPWWSASVAVDLSLSPWSLTSTGGWLEFHPPQWEILTTPWMTVDGSVGWGPQWIPAREWIHTLRGSLDVQAIWSLPTLWETPLDLCAASILDADWAFPNGSFITDWTMQLDARSILPLFANGDAALRAGARAQATLLPLFGFGFDVRLELRASRFMAYGLVGAGGAGIRAEIGVEWSMAWSLSGDLDE